MENFEPEKIVRVRWWWDDRSGYYKVNKPGIDLMDAVSASDYDKLLALYRGAVDDAEGYKGTIKKIWTQLGDPTYEELKGRSIFEVIQELIR